MQDANGPQDLNDDQLNTVTGGTGRLDTSTISNTLDLTGMSDPSGMNIPDMIMANQIARGNVLDSQIKDQMANSTNRNDWLKEANAVLAVLRANNPTGQPNQENSFGTIRQTAADGSVSSISVETWMTRNGIAMTDRGADHRGSEAEFDTAIANLKSSIDTVNSQSQMDMIRLQGLMDKRNQAFDMMTNSLSKTGKQVGDIVGKMR